MALLNETQRQQMLANYKAGVDAHSTGAEYNPRPVVRIFAGAACAWLLTELLPHDENTAFGLCDLGLGFPELGYVNLQELADEGAEIDKHFKPDKTLSAYVADANAKGFINS